MNYHLILCTRICDPGDVNLDKIYRQVLKHMKTPEEELDGATLLCNNAMIVTSDQMHRLGALILAELIDRGFPYIVFELQENAWVAYDNTGELIEDILENSS